MNELVTAETKDTITSLELVEQINMFREQVEGKAELKHYDLLKIVRDEFEQEINEGKIPLVKYKDKKGEERPMYILTFNQAKQVLVRESKRVRKAVIEYIEKLENALKNKFQVPTNFKEALLLAVKQQEKIEELQEEVEVRGQLIGELKPAKDYLDTILASGDTMKITQIASDYGLSAVALNKILNEQRIIRKVNKQWILYNTYTNKGYTKSHTFTVKENKTIIETVWTQKGRLFIHETLTKLGYKANMDKELEVNNTTNNKANETVMTLGDYINKLRYADLNRKENIKNEITNRNEK
jgi:prophage antirepressor